MSETQNGTLMARSGGRFYKNLVCIVLIIGAELDIMRKSFTTRKNTYMELIFHKKSVYYAKGLCLHRQLEKCPKSSKNGQNRDFEPRSQGARVFRIFRRSVFKEVEEGK